MKLNQVWELSKEGTAKVSELIRQIAYAGIAIIWIFRTTNNTILDSLVLPAILLILALLLDLIQYISNHVKFRRLAIKTKEALGKQGIPDDKQGDFHMEIPPNFHLFSHVLFWYKIILVFASYIIILYNLSRIIL